jgi:hypothetical protein
LLIAAVCGVTGCQDNSARDAKIADLEHRISALEIETKQRAESTQERNTALLNCVASADVAYKDNLRRNATKNGSGYSASVYAVQAAQSEKREAVEECKLLYGKWNAMKIVGFLIVLAAAYAAFHWLFGRGWLATSSCLIIWLLLASLYKPGPRGWNQEKRILKSDGGAGRIRTADLEFRKLLLYPSELRPR